MWKYYKLWIWTAFRHSLGVADALAGALGFIFPAIRKLLPFPQPWDDVMNDLLWQLPLGILSSLFLIRLLLAPYWIYREQQVAIDKLKTTSDRVNGIARIFNLHEDPISRNWHAAVRLERHPDFPDIDPPDEDRCEVNLIITDSATQSQWSCRAPVGDDQGGYIKQFTLSLEDNPRDVWLVQRHGTNCRPCLAGDLEPLLEGREYMLEAKVHRGIRLFGSQQYTISVDTNRNVTMAER